MPPTVAVIGAGAAGLTAALRAAEAGSRVTLLNAHPKIGLKILMSGGTRCNVTHKQVTERDYWGGSRPVVARILRAFTAEQTRGWMESLGVSLKLEPTGKYFPVTDDAQTVLDALLRAAERAGVEVRTGARVVRLQSVAPAVAAPTHETAAAGVGRPAMGGAPAGMSQPWRRPDAPPAHAAPGTPRTWNPPGTPRNAPPSSPPTLYRIGIQTVLDSAAFSDGVARHGEKHWETLAAQPDHWLEADRVVLAAGGLSFPRTGSDGTGYALATALGHTIVPPVPALTPLAAADPLCASAQGLTLEAELTLWVDKWREIAVRGSFLVTHFGYSGPAALDLSRHWHHAEGHGERRVTASFLPEETMERMQAAWLAAARSDSQLSVRRHLGASLPDRLTVALCEEAEVSPAAALGQVSRERRAALLGLVLTRPLSVTGTLGYEKAEVTAGGVPFTEVDPSTLESRRSAGLFLCGEILDVDGRLGGFNFQWAWSSGTVAGAAAAREPRLPGARPGAKPEA